MVPDIKTVIVFSSFIVTFIGLALLFYRANQKTYPGFGYWIVGTLVLAFGYQFLFLRNYMPIWINIPISNISFMLAAILKWEGVARFLNGKRLPKAIYLSPLLIISVLIYFFAVNDNIILRAFVLNSFLFTICLLIFREFIQSWPTAEGPIFKVTGVIYLFYGSMILARSLFWLLNPSSTIFNAGPFHGIYYIAVTLFELALGISFLMMNGRRIEEELRRSKSNLHDSVIRLENALSEIKTLTGMLPICASCKKIRDDKGYWNQIETYIENHSQALFSHGICPECAEMLYKDTRWYQKTKDEME